LTLCNPDKSELYSLGLAYKTNITLRYNAISEFKFIFPKSIDGGITNLEAYEQVKNKKLVLVEGYGYYVINDASESMDGSIPIKNVSCNSLEYELISKRITGYGGTVKLYDTISPTGTLLYDMIQLAPNWSVGTIDASLELLYRTFNVADTNIYGFLAGEVSSAFECIFIFDTNNRTISAVANANATSQSDIFLSFDNLIDKAELSEKTDEITTSLSVYGGGNLNIRAVNPLGTDKIYDFSYYMSTDWMSSGLITAITTWEALIASNQSTYASLLSLLITYNTELISLQSVLATYNNEYLVLQGLQKVRIQGALPYTDITAQMVAKQLQIDTQNTLILNKQTQISNVTADIQEINTLVSFANNFTAPQLLELNNFIYENTYQNENIIQTDLMTVVDIQNAQQALYNQAINVLGRVSQPRYEISFQAVNYLDLPEFAVFTNQTELGSTFFVELSDTQQVETVLLEINMTFDNPSDFSMTFSNRLRLDNGKFVYSDLFGNVVKMGSNVSFNNLLWSNWNTTYKDDVSLFITSALDTTTNNLISNSNQEILINQNGLRGRTIIPGTSAYKQTQVWLTSSVLAFSNDGFVTSKVALGEVTPGVFGLVADSVYGVLLAGSSLKITNNPDDANSNFILDATGATLKNAKFSIIGNNAKILMDINSSDSKIFKIQKIVSGTPVDKFVVNSAGDVTFSGALSGASGNFSGTVTASTGLIGNLVIDASGLRTSNSVNYLRGDGSMRWGALTVASNGATTFGGSLHGASGTFSGDISSASGVFSGNVYADRLYGEVNFNQIVGVSFDKIFSGLAQSGTMLSWPGGFNIYDGGSGYGVIDALRIEIMSTRGNGSIIGLDDGVLTLSANAIVIMPETGFIEINGDLKIYKRFYSSSSLYLGYGINSRQPISTPSGTRYMYISNGIIVGILTT
jgi:hypothetical protein